MAVPCAGCHGDDGRGRPEGGVIPTDITWSYLTKPYGHHHPSGRRHPAFTEESVASSITVGIDSAENRLDPAMPRYAISTQDMSALIAYMKRLESDLDPGITETSIKLGTVLPLQGRLGSLGQAMKGVMQAYFDDVNKGGGIYGRRIELIVADYTDDPVYGLGKVRGLLDKASVFALVSAFTAGLDQELVSLTEDKRVPLVGPFTQFPQAGLGLTRYTFYLFPGLSDQARVLVEYAARALKFENPRIAVIHSTSAGHSEIAKAVAAQCKKHGWTNIAERAQAPGEFDFKATARALHAQGTDVVFFFGSGGELWSIAQQMPSLDWKPYVLLPGSLAGRFVFDLPAVLQGRILLSYPSLPGDRTRAGLTAFEDLRKRHGLVKRHNVAQISAYTASVVLVEGLKRAGKQLNRAKLVTALEGLYRFESGLTPAISYSANRRIGVLGAHIVAVDLKQKQFKPVGQWIELK